MCFGCKNLCSTDQPLHEICADFVVKQRIFLPILTKCYFVYNVSLIASTTIYLYVHVRK